MLTTLLIFGAITLVVAIEGDRLAAAGDELLVNGKSIGDCCMSSLTRPLPDMRPLELPVVVPPGRLFLLGDNRPESLDSRFWGFADAGQVIARAVIIYASAPPTAPSRPVPLAELSDPPDQPRWRRIGKAVE